MRLSMHTRIVVYIETCYLLLMILIGYCTQNILKMKIIIVTNCCKVNYNSNSNRKELIVNGVGVIELKNKCSLSREQITLNFKNYVKITLHWISKINSAKTLDKMLLGKHMDMSEGIMQSAKELDEVKKNKQDQIDKEEFEIVLVIVIYCYCK